MDKHYGSIVERVIRRNGYSISELARAINVSRRVVYKWFTKKTLKPEIIFRIGNAIKHDFFVEFPEHFSSEEFERALKLPEPLEPKHADLETGAYTSDYWKDKYIALLEEYIELLQSQKDQKELDMETQNKPSAIQ